MNAKSIDRTNQRREIEEIKELVKGIEGKHLSRTGKGRFCIMLPRIAQGRE